MLKSIDLCKVKLRLECIRVVDNLYLERCDGNACDDIEKVCILKIGNEYVSLFGEYSLAGKDISWNKIFESDEYAESMVPTIELRRELWYYFEYPPSTESQLVVELGDTEDTFDTFVVLENGNWISRAWSVRKNADSAEIAVETKEGYRRKGYGSQVVSAWVKSQISKGKVGIYAHRKYNLESMYLAQKSGAVLFADVLSLQ